MGTPLPPPQKGQPPIFGLCLLRPNGWMDEAGTWHGGRSQPRRLCVRWRGAPCRIFGPFLLRPNGWMHQDATWYRCRPQPRGLCVIWRPSPPPKRGRSSPTNPSPIFSHVYCGQTAGWIKMPLATKVGLSPGDSVLDGDPAPCPQRGWSPLLNFQPISIVAKRLDASRCHLVWR